MPVHRSHSATLPVTRVAADAELRIAPPTAFAFCSEIRPHLPSGWAISCVVCDDRQGVMASPATSPTPGMKIDPMPTSGVRSPN
jgi:hypothetical protein